MSGFFDKMLGRGGETDKGSSAKAKDRLKMVLTHDRIKISPEKMNEMKAEIIAVITRYLPSLDPESVDIALDQSGRHNNKLVAEIPFASERETASLYDDDDDGNDDLLAAQDSYENSPLYITDDEATAENFKLLDDVLPEPDDIDEKND